MVSNFHFRCGKVYSSFITLHFGCKELDNLFGDVLVHVGQKSITESNSCQLASIIRTSVGGNRGSACAGSRWKMEDALAGLENLLPLLDHVLEVERRKVAKEILAQLGALSDVITEPLTISCAIYLATVLAQSVDALTISGTVHKAIMYIISIILLQY